MASETSVGIGGMVVRTFFTFWMNQTVTTLGFNYFLIVKYNLYIVLHAWNYFKPIHFLLQDIGKGVGEVAKTFLGPMDTKYVNPALLIAIKTVGNNNILVNLLQSDLIFLQSAGP